jgi:potassium efflux system protein
MLLALALFTTPGLAQQPANGVVAEQGESIRGYGGKADGLELRMAASAEDDAQLVEIRNQLEGLSRDLLASSVAFRPRLAEINTRLEQIGPPPAEGEPAEPAVLRAERASLQQEKAEINALLGEAENLSLRISRLIGQIAQMRRDLFATQLSKRYDITAALSTQVLADLAAEAEVAYQRFSSWLRFVTQYKLRSVLLAAFFALSAAALLLIGGRRAFGRLIHADPAQEAPSYLSRLSVAFWSTLLPSMALAVFLAATYFFLGYFNVLRPDIAEILTTLFNVIATVYFINRLARAAFSPRLPNWRLVPVDTQAASRLFWLTWTTSVVTGIDFVLTRVNAVLGSPLSLTIAKSLVATVIVGILVVLIGSVRPFRDEAGNRKHWPALLRYPMHVIGAATIIAAVLGYIGLARFISQQIVVTGAILATMYIGHLSALALSDFGAFTQTALGRRLDKRFNFDETVEDQIGLAVSVVIHLLVAAIGVPLILLQWGFQWGDITTWALGVAREIRIGSISFSLIGILTGLFVFLIGYFATRWLQSWLDGSVMARGRVDAGVRNSIRTVVGYAGLAVAGLIGISAAGINLSSLALVAGGLSLGIGFGLQNIVQNFVSGLILLAERPFKAGDWIVAGAVSGTVRKISVRATEIETFQKQTVILPNSELINAAVGNWTHKNRLARTEVKIVAAYGSDARRVHQLLLDVVRAQPMVLKNPEPFVALTNIADMGLEFEVRAFVTDVYNSATVQNELRFAILEMFEREGIVLSFAPRAFYPKEQEAKPAEPPPEPADAEEQTAAGEPGVAGAKPRRGRPKRES